MNPKLIDKAYQIAQHAYKDQSYGVFPYIYHLNHLKQVDEVLKEYFLEYGSDDIFLINIRCVAYLHDTLENTRLKYRDLEKIFGAKIADDVYCLTNEIGRNDREVAEKTLPKIIKNPVSTLVKLADRYANVVLNGDKVEKYKKTADLFEEYMLKAKLKDKGEIGKSLKSFSNSIFHFRKDVLNELRTKYNEIS